MITIHFKWYRRTVFYFDIEWYQSPSNYSVLVMQVARILPFVLLFALPSKHILNLNKLNCFKYRKRCFHVSYHILDCVQPKITKFTVEQPYVFFPACQYHACWCPGDFRTQGISRHGFEHQSGNIPSPESEELTALYFQCIQKRQINSTQE